jgi:peroxin-19
MCLKVTQLCNFQLMSLTPIHEQTRPGNTTELMALMQEVQEYGQPPSDIIREIAPGLELDANGLPKLNDSLPSMPGGGGGDECRVM